MTELSVEKKHPKSRNSSVAEESTNPSLLELATELTMAWLANPNTRASAEEVPVFLQSMHGAVTNLAAPQASTEEVAPAKEYSPAVTVRRSLASRDHIISLIDGKAYKTLKRHLSGHGLTPAEYRERYGLKADYPMVAEAYAEMRRGLAKKIGLGRKPGTKVGTKAPAKAAAKTAPKAKAVRSPKTTAPATTQS
jgi:predicted transcriptional regulator